MKSQATYAGWKRAVKASYPEAMFYGDKDIAGAHVPAPGTKPATVEASVKAGGGKQVGEWDGEKGEVWN